jgi:hypothetical protein
MRKFVIVTGVLTAAVLLPSETLARNVQITGTHSRGELLGACQASGGSCGNCRGTSGSYHCHNLDSGTSVYCTSGGKCTGWVPARVQPGHGLGGILTPPNAGVKQTSTGQIRTTKSGAPTVGGKRR